MVTRVTDDADRRSARVRITPDGRRTLERIRTLKNAFLARRLSELSPEEQAGAAELVALLEHLVRPVSRIAEARHRTFARPGGPQLPPVLHRSGHLGLGHLDADGGADLPHPVPAPRHRRRCRHGHRSAVPPTAAPRPLRWAHRRPARQAQGPLCHAVVSRAPGAGARPAGRHPLGRSRTGVRPAPHCSAWSTCSTTRPARRSSPKWSAWSSCPTR